MTLCENCFSSLASKDTTIFPTDLLFLLAGAAPTSEATPTTHSSNPTTPSLLSSEEPDPYLELDELDQSIAKVESYLAQLVRQRLPIKTRINQLKSPILRMLPPELLARIFSFYIPDFHEPVGKGIKPTSNPLTLGAICRTWRNVAWSTPELWTTISLYLSFSKITVLTPLVEEWLSRSGQLALYIRLWCGAGEDRKLADYHVFAMLSILSRYSTRWKALELRIPTTFFSGFTYDEDDIQKTPLILSSLHLDPPDGQADRTERFTFGATPFLTKLHISSIYLKAISIQWTNITHIYASAFYFDECLEILQRCPNLIRCEFSSIINGDDGYTIPSEMIQLPYLTYFRLCNDGPILPTDVLNKITAPSLEEFFFQAGGRLVHGDDLASFITRSGCSSTLRSFGLAKGDLAQPDLVRVLECMPCLRRLSITAGETFHLNLTDEVVQRVCSGCVGGKNVAQKALLPRLESFEYVGTQSFGWRPFMDMLCNYGRVAAQAAAAAGVVGLGSPVLTQGLPSTSVAGSSSVVVAECLKGGEDALLSSVSSNSVIATSGSCSGTAASIQVGDVKDAGTSDGLLLSSTSTTTPYRPSHPLAFQQHHYPPTAIPWNADCPGDQHTLRNIDISFTTHDGNDPILIDREYLAVLLNLMDSGVLALQMTHLHGSKDLLASSVAVNLPEEEERYQRIRAKLDGVAGCMR